MLVNMNFLTSDDILLAKRTIRKSCYNQKWQKCENDVTKEWSK